MKIFVAGASGKTGLLVVGQLLERGIATKIVVRVHAILPNEFSNNPLVEIITGDIDTFSQEKMKQLIIDCNAVICCLGHRITLKGMFGKPRNLVVHAVEKITAAIKDCGCKQKFILMSTTAYTNRKQGESISFIDASVLSIFRVLLPPHRDNMLAADYLVSHLNDTNNYSYVAVRPDSLFDEDQVSDYEVQNNRTRSPVFNAGRTSRINVAHFMIQLIESDVLWDQWKGKFPVVYNKIGSSS